MTTFEAVTITVILAAFAAGSGGIWLIIQRQSPTTWAMMVARQDALEAKNDALETKIDQLEDDLLDARREMDDWRRGMKLVFEQMRVANLVPIWQPEERQYRARPDATLAQRIAAQFNIDEMNMLAFDIGILSDEFGGATREARARELVDLVARRGTSYTAALNARIKELRSEK